MDTTEGLPFLKCGNTHARLQAEGKTANLYDAVNNIDTGKASTEASFT